MTTLTRSRRPSPWHLVLAPLAALMLVPLVWMLITSLSTEAETRRFPPGLPATLRWGNFRRAWDQAPFGHWLLNSAVVSGTCVISNLVLCSLAGYAFARINFAGRQLAFFAML
ncbi:MAG TPA: carbohydrate ABC transporter permease, partial [Acidothermaceae bacterium]